MVVAFDRAFLFSSLGEAWRARRALYVGLAATWIVLALLLATDPRPHSAGFSAGVSPRTYLMNQAPAIVGYLQQSVWPNALVLLYGWPQPLTLADVWPAALFVCLLLGFTGVALWKQPQLGFVGAWFWVTLAPTSSIVPIATEVAAERRMYLPLGAVVLLAVVGLVWLWDRLKRRIPALASGQEAGPVIAGMALLIAASGLALGTVARNSEFASPVTMGRTVVARHPTPIGHLSLGRALLAAGQRDEGLMHVRQAIPGAPGAHLTLGLQLVTEGQLDEGVAQLQAFVRDQKPLLADVVVARLSMGEIFLHQERWAEAAEQFRLVLATLPGNPIAEHRLADASFSMGLWEEAALHYQAHLRRQPQDAGALNNLGIALGSSGRVDEARQAFRQALAIEPHNGPAHHNLASIFLKDLDVTQALVHARRAVDIQPGAASSHELLGRILLGQGRLDEAERQFERVLELNPSSHVARDEIALLRRSRTLDGAGK
jgi:tetratricopeptide (TPR) repeat protein